MGCRVDRMGHAGLLYSLLATRYSLLATPYFSFQLAAQEILHAVRQAQQVPPPCPDWEPATWKLEEILAAIAARKQVRAAVNTHTKH